MRQTMLLEDGENVFQRVKRKTAEAENRGIKIIKLSIGQPQGPALLNARRKAAEAVMSAAEKMHEYQDNGSPGVPDFAKQFAQAHVKRQLDGILDIDFLPIPGIKPMLGLIPLACGHPNNTITVQTMSEPGYGVPGTWCKYLRANDYSLPLNSKNRFLFSLDDIKNKTNLIMTNYPNNPSGQVAPKSWLKELCEYCAEYDIRIANDAAYSMLVHSNTKDFSTLADVAIDYSSLSWLEMYSASKEIGNGTGWRIGAAVGSTDFIKDLKTIKGNTDSGFVAPMAAGVLSAMLNDRERIIEFRDLYEKRLRMLIKTLSFYGMGLIVEPRAGFFSLWKVPSYTFDKTVENAEHFNDLMLNNTGVVGVPISNYIRYSVAGFPVEEKKDEIVAAFAKANISYS